MGPGISKAYVTPAEHGWGRFRPAFFVLGWPYVFLSLDTGEYRTLDSIYF